MQQPYFEENRIEDREVVRADIAPPTTNGHATFEAAGLAKGALAGAVAGVAGAAAMQLMMKGMQRALPEKGEQRVREMQQGMNETRQAVADRVTTAVADRPLPPEHAKEASMAVHYATGALGGAIYGAAAELSPRVTIGHGAGFGAAFFVASALVALPAMGFAPPPNETPIKQHGMTLGMHVAYGLVAESVRAPVREALGS